MRAYVSRDSVAAGDDAIAPNARHLTLPDDWTWEVLAEVTLRGTDLPLIAGGKATGVLSSGIPIAVVAQEWRPPKLLLRLRGDREHLDATDREIRLHWSYLAQRDPDEVFDILGRLTLRAAQRARV